MAGASRGRGAAHCHQGGPHGQASARPLRDVASVLLRASTWVGRPRWHGLLWPQARFPAAVVEEAGAPRAFWTELRSEGPGRLAVDIVLQDKTPTRLPEALWLRCAGSRLHACSEECHGRSSAEGC